MSEPLDLARVRHDNALRLFDEFVHANVKSADAATLRGLERRFAERLQIQPSYWSQIKARSRQIGERLARQFEQLCRKPAGWMDQRHDAAGFAAASPAPSSASASAGQAGTEGRGAMPAPGSSLQAASSPSQPLDDDERFIVGLVLTYYRRHPQRARTRLLDLLGEVLTPDAVATAGGPSATSPAIRPAPSKPAPRGAAPGVAPGAAPAPAAVDDLALWQRSQAGVAPLPRKR